MLELLIRYEISTRFVSETVFFYLAVSSARFFIEVIFTEFKSTLMDSSAVNRSLIRIAHEITEKNSGTDNICLVGIKRRGVPLAKDIALNIEKIESTKIPTGIIDIKFYRDDLSKEFTSPHIDETDINFDVTGKKIVLVDDVLFTGRTVRAAIEALFSLGRPAAIQLAILIDRGHRELPIRPDFIGKNVPTSLNELIKVNVPDYDGETSVKLYSV